MICFPSLRLKDENSCWLAGVDPVIGRGEVGRGETPMLTTRHVILSIRMLSFWSDRQDSVRNEETITVVQVIVIETRVWKWKRGETPCISDRLRSPPSRIPSPRVACTFGAKGSGRSLIKQRPILHPVSLHSTHYLAWSDWREITRNWETPTERQNYWSTPAMGVLCVLIIFGLFGMGWIYNCLLIPFFLLDFVRMMQIVCWFCFWLTCSRFDKIKITFLLAEEMCCGKQRDAIPLASILFTGSSLFLLSSLSNRLILFIPRARESAREHVKWWVR